eukprot:CAMPEP_0172547052 /NCGR_PEP_ID=MMETSP1067-20121228/16681_1 /TAXON_ID=265564 ORGANISM="Thalassiosira punctigera, Strain Tpunct2005C2" /NCGR_SAMPLE_ID=MMETSP1067 /ASSEMBLY_ACC=CAM_ASM_000444 /LENGTH=211 /DNA_ID=CAMNT_0013334073 /DNA_START=1 /DNA_END=632 /DNA_ORIENTATION=+
MNDSWRDCDTFTKLVLNELADEGRARYRQRIEEYDRQCRRAKSQGQHGNVGEATPTSSHGKKAAKKKMPAETLIAPKAPVLPPSKSYASSEDSVMNETAKAMVQLATSAPSNFGSKMCSSFIKEDSLTVGRAGRFDLTAKKDIPNESNPILKESIGTMPNNMNAPTSSREISTVAFLHATEERQALRLREKLMIRVRELERQLEGERVVRA